MFPHFFVLHFCLSPWRTHRLPCISLCLLFMNTWVGTHFQGVESRCRIFIKKKTTDDHSSTFFLLFCFLFFVLRPRALRPSDYKMSFRVGLPGLNLRPAQVSKYLNSNWSRSFPIDLPDFELEEESPHNLSIVSYTQIGFELRLCQPKFILLNATAARIISLD